MPLIFLGACASVASPDITVPIQSPGQFASAPPETAPSASDWIAGFNDPLLTTLVEEALEANPTVADALASFDAAQAIERISGLARLPNLDASAGYTDRAPGNTVWSSGLDISWQADIWGRLSDQTRSGVLMAEAARADWYGARLSIAASTARAWYALTEAGQQVALAQADVQTRVRQLELVKRRFARGIARSSDVRTARSALASSRSSLASRQRSRAAAARQLEVILGRYPGAAIAMAEDLPRLGPLPDPGGPEAMLSRRPDVVAAQARLAAAGYSASAARKALYPGLNLSAAVSDSSDDPGSALDFDGLVKTVAGSISAPIFQGGQLRAQRDQAEAQVRQLSAILVNTALNALREAEDAIDADQRLHERVTALTEAASEAREALTLVERQYGSGLATIFELIDAQTRVISAQSQLIAVRSNRVDNRIALHLAIAGAFSAAGVPESNSGIWNVTNSPRT